MVAHFNRPKLSDELRPIYFFETSEFARLYFERSEKSLLSSHNHGLTNLPHFDS